MRNFRLILKSQKTSIDLLINEKQEVCILNTQTKNLNIKNYLDRIEIIIKNWKQNTTSKKLVLDGLFVSIYWQKGNDEILQLKYNDLTLPKNFMQLYTILEEINEK